jgi:anti-sigma regulatory factor (Ser/Thr protein kinase)
MSKFKKSFHIKGRDFIRAGEASINVQNLLKSMVSLEIDTDKLILEIFDDGPGIEDIDLAMQAGYSTANDDHREMGFGAGMGLPNMKKNSDQIHIVSKKEQGTVVRMIFFLSEGGKTD